MVAVSASPVPAQNGDYGSNQGTPSEYSNQHQRRSFFPWEDLNPGPFPDYSRYRSPPIVAPTWKDSTKQSPVKKNTSPKKQHLSIKSRSLTDRKKSKPTKKTTGPSPGQQNPGSKYQSPPFFPEQKPSNLEKFPTILPSRPGRIGIPEQRYPDLEKFPTITRPRIGVPAQKYPNLEKFPTVADQVVKPQFVRRGKKSRGKKKKSKGKSMGAITQQQPLMPEDAGLSGPTADTPFGSSPVANAPFGSSPMPLA
ncbi:hypothetical protein GGI12_003577 [Dipsacomyces acuminosporus]|nr:hypothetical protein GGI12_003577 [Dipsacomyces acuminosporus]